MHQSTQNNNNSNKCPFVSVQFYALRRSLIILLKHFFSIFILFFFHPASIHSVLVMYCIEKLFGFLLRAIVKHGFFRLVDGRILNEFQSLSQPWRDHEHNVWNLNFVCNFLLYNLLLPMKDVQRFKNRYTKSKKKIYINNHN